MVDKLSWDEAVALLNQLSEDVENQSFPEDELLSRYYSLGKQEIFTRELTYKFLPTFDKITEKLSDDRFRKELSKYIDTAGKTFRGKLDQFLYMTASENKNGKRLIAYFDEALKYIQKDIEKYDCKKDFLPKFTLLIQNKDQYDYITKKLEDFPQEIKEETKDTIYSNLGYIYQSAPALRPTLWNAIITGYNPEKLSYLYDNLDAVASIALQEDDKNKEQECLQLIIRNLFDSKNNNTKKDLEAAYMALGKIRQNPELKEIVDTVIKKAVNLPNNNNKSKRLGYKEIEQYDELRSNVIIGQRISKTAENPNGFKHVDNIPYDKPSVLFFGGTGSDDDKAANGYLSRIEKNLQSERHHLDKHVDLYAIIHDFGDRIYAGSGFEFDANNARAIYFVKKNVPTIGLFKKAGKEIIGPEFSDDTANPKYVYAIFDRAFAERICDEKGNKLPVEEACKRMRNITICAHCHGAYTFAKLEDIIQNKMTEIGYSAQERVKIQKELLCIAYAPDAPLGKSKSTMISFVSAGDYKLSFRNNFSNGIRQMNRMHRNIDISYLPGRKGEIFIAKEIYAPTNDDDDNPDVEHTYLSEKDLDKLTNDGKILARLSSNAIANGVKSSIEGTPLPDTETLVCGNDEQCKKTFTKMKENGDRLWNEIEQIAILNAKQRHQKNTILNARNELEK